MPNPFQHLLDPEAGRGSIMGFIGGLTGAPTAGETRGQLTGTALQSLAKMREDGATPQQALVQFLKTPEGIDYFTQNPNGLGKLTDALTATQAPAPTLHNLAAGGQLYATQPGSTDARLIASNPAADKTKPQVVGGSLVDNEGKVLYSAPTNEQKNFDYFGGIANLPKPELQNLARLQIDPNKQPSDTRAAVDNLVKNYGLNPAMGEGIVAGTIKVLPIKDQYSQDTGDVSVVDLANNTVTRLSPGQKAPGSTAPATAAPNAPLPGSTPETGSAVGVIPPAKATDPLKNNPYFGDKATMFLGAGPVAQVLGGVSKAGEAIAPELITKEGSVANDRENLINNTRNALVGMGKLDSRLKATVDSMLAMAPSSGLTSSPHEAVQKGIRLLQTINQESAAEEAKTTRVDLPKEERVNAAQRMEGWRGVARTLPTMEEMLNMEKAIREGTAGAPNVGTLVKSTIEQGKNVYNSAKSQLQGVTDDFSSMDVPALSKWQQDNPKPTPAQAQKFKARVLQLKGAK